jgi:hypothetical protein
MAKLFSPQTISIGADRFSLFIINAGVRCLLLVACLQKATQQEPKPYNSQIAEG